MRFVFSLEVLNTNSRQNVSRHNLFAPFFPAFGPAQNIQIISLNFKTLSSPKEISNLLGVYHPAKESMVTEFSPAHFQQGVGILLGLPVIIFF